MMTKKMTNGNDLLEHVEKCEACQKIEDRMENFEEGSPEYIELLEEQYSCWDNSFNEGE
jgi:hypothetical protein